jgi:hypothetical protein
MLLYILYCPPPPTCDCKDILILGHPITSPPSLNSIKFKKIIKYEKRERNGISKEYFILSVGVALQRYDTSKFEKNAFFTKSAAVHNFYIANSPWNLDLNSKSHKI